MSSLKEIATELDVSYSLVSKVLNGRLGTTGVSEPTRVAIYKKAKELGYTPNRLAVALKSGRNGSVGVFLHTLGTPGSEVTDRLLRGLASGLEGSGFQMWLRFFSDEDEFLGACGNHLKDKVDGLIVAGVRHSELIAKLQEINTEGLPVVSVFSDLPASLSAKIANVGVDWKEQGLLGTQHLLDQGCTRLATFRSSSRRFDGFVAAHAERGLSVDSDRIVPNIDYSIEGGRNGVNDLFARHIDFDGIFCECDAQAIGVVQELREQGRKIPDEVKVVGIDNSPLASACIVPITSVTPEMIRSGRDAVQLLLKKIEGEAVKSTLLHPKIVVRASSMAV